MATLGLEKATQTFRQIFDELDADKDGGITWNELESNIGKADPEKARQLMDLADRNRDHRIEFDEFVAFVKVVLKAEGLTFDTLTQANMDHFRQLFH